MPEPDFERIADTICDEAAGSMRENIANALRHVWNARGSADIEAINDVAHTNDVAVENAIRSIDR